ncbi:MAG TPA: L-threonylcarbamoyladenylate synthase [Candidatus Saccharimonadales bacterium]|nr:L-threonylcarbamoyladenylate synthase [Candidatus Saccharimonadales bacterium]
MNIIHQDDTAAVTAALRAGKIGVIRTDTLYGLVCRADSQAAVERIYQVKGRDDNKSPIVLVASAQQLFDAPDGRTGQLLTTVWPGKVSVIIPTIAAPSWIERGNKSVAYRLPDNTWLQSTLAQTGPLIAPSANPQSRPPAQTIRQAIAYFGEQVDFYVDGGEVTDDTPSQLLCVSVDGAVEKLR